jgi:cytochrome c
MAAHAAHAETDLANGQQLFAGACAACHSLEPDRNMTGPSLSALWGRKSGSLSSFPRYSAAIKSAEIVWNDEALEKWLADPKAFIPHNRMTYPGLPDKKSRADLIAFLKNVTRPGEQRADTTPGMTGMDAEVPNLKFVPPASQVKEIKYCGDTYTITTADGSIVQFWERNLRFKTDASKDGPLKGFPAIVGAGMVGDRASIIFAAPEEFGQFIKRRC